MSDYHEIAERDHDIQNPTSADKIRLLGEYLRLGPESRVLDIACGKGGPALILASEFGCHVTGVELRAAFAGLARERVAEAGLESLIEVHTADAKTLPLEPESWDAALCLGASFVWGTIAETAAVLAPSVRRGGFVAVGEPYWRGPPSPPGTEAQDFVGFEETIARFTASGLALTGVVASSQDDWDRYESLHWRALEEWLDAHPDDQDIRAALERFRRRYLEFRRDRLGWAIFVGRV